jgi:hypothetical protein
VSTCFILIGLGGICLHDSYVVVGVLSLVGAAAFLGLAVRALLVREPWREGSTQPCRDPARLPVYEHLSTVLMLLGIGGIALRGSQVVVGVVSLVGAAGFLALAVRSVLLHRGR